MIFFYIIMKVLFFSVFYNLFYMPNKILNTRYIGEWSVTFSLATVQSLCGMPHTHQHSFVTIAGTTGRAGVPVR